MQSKFRIILNGRFFRHGPLTFYLFFLIYMIWYGRYQGDAGNAVHTFPNLKNMNHYMIWTMAFMNYYYKLYDAQEYFITVACMVYHYCILKCGAWLANITHLISLYIAPLLLVTVTLKVMTSTKSSSSYRHTTMIHHTLFNRNMCYLHL